MNRFSTHTYGYEDKVSKETRLTWIPINTQVREEIVNKVYLTDLRLQDTYYQFSALTEDDRRIFNNRYEMIRPYEFVDNIHL